MGIIAQHATQFRDGALEHIVGDEGVRPYCLEKFFFGDSLTRVLGQTHQYFHYLSLHPVGCAVLSDAIQAGFDQPGSDLEVTIQCISPDEQYDCRFSNEPSYWGSP